MAVSIRLKMLGTKHKPSYRIVALDSRKNRDGITLENLGMYDPLAAEAKVEIKEEEVISVIFTIVTSLTAAWKNNSFTEEAIKADEYLKELREGAENNGD